MVNIKNQRASLLVWKLTIGNESQLKGLAKELLLLKLDLEKNTLIFWKQESLPKKNEVQDNFTHVVTLASAHNIAGELCTLHLM